MLHTAYHCNSAVFISSFTSSAQGSWVPMLQTTQTVVIWQKKN